METKEQLLNEMKNWEGVNNTLYKQALYKYNALISQEKVTEVVAEKVVEEPKEIIQEFIEVQKEEIKPKRKR
jgi:hypothetical protein